MKCTEIAGWTIMKAVVDACLAISILSLNSFIIYAVGRKWRKDGIPFGQESSTLFLLNLSTADTFLGLSHVYLVLPDYSCNVHQYVSFNFTPCILRYTFSLTCHYASNLTMLAITVDRYLSVAYAVRYRDLLNKRRALITVAVIWIMSTTPSSLFFWNNWKEDGGCEIINVMPEAYNYSIILSLNLIVASTILFVTWKIHMVVLRLRERNKPLSVAEKVNTKTFRIIVSFLLIYIITWIPYNVVTYMKYDNYDVSSAVLHVTYSFTKVNYIANPFIFAYHMRLPRTAMINVYRNVRNRMGIELSTTSSSPISDTTPNRLPKSSGSFSSPPIQTIAS